MKIMAMLCCILLSFSLHSQDEQNSLEFIAKIAVLNNPLVKQKYSQFIISQQDQEIAEANNLPKVELTVESSETSRSFGQNQDFLGNQGQLNIVQNIFNGLLTASEIERLHEASKVRYFELKAEIETIALETTFAYLDVLLYRQQLASAEENLKTHITVYKQVEESNNAGISRGVDLEQINGRLALAESNVMTEQANLYDVSARFLRLVGSPPPSELIKPKIENVNEQIEVLLKEAHTKNPNLIAALFNVYSQRAGVESAKSSNMPNLDAVFGYSAQSRGPLGEKDSREESKIGLRLSWTLYNGGEDRSRVEQALSQVDLALNKHEQVCRDIRQTLQIAYNEVLNLKKQIPVLNDHKLSSSSVKSAYLDQFKIGKRDLLDVLDTENEAFEASRAHTEATFSFLKATYRIYFSTGTLGEKLNVEEKITQMDSPSLPYHPDYVCPALDKKTTLINSDVLKKDTDMDGVTDLWDDCQDSKTGDVVNDYGCPVSQ